MTAKLTLDKAGRVVLPKPLGDRLQLAPGDTLHLETEGECITLRPVRQNVALKKPVKPMIPPEQALLFVEEVRVRLPLVSISPEEYFATIQDISSRGFTGGRVYDTLLLACAAKCKAQTVYTWNLKHYQSLAPALASRIQTP